MPSLSAYHLTWFSLTLDVGLLLLAPPLTLDVKPLNQVLFRNLTEGYSLENSFFGRDCSKRQWRSLLVYIWIFWLGNIVVTCVCVCVHARALACSVAKSCLTLCDPFGLWPTRLFCPCDFQGKNTAVGCHSLLQRIFPTHGLNPCFLRLLYWQENSLPLSYLGSSNNEQISQFND